METAFLYLIAFVNLVSLIHLGFYIVGANIYDIRKFRGAVSNRRAAKKRKRPHATPLLSVIVPAYNEEVGIVRTLDSLLACDYPNFEIIVVDDGSKDHTAAIVRAYIARLNRTRVHTYMGRDARNGSLNRRTISQAPTPRPRIQLVSQTNQGKGAALNNALQNYTNGKLVMCLDADSLVRSDALTNTVAYFRDPKVMGVAANVRVMGNNSWLSLLQRFEHMIGYRSKKFYSLTGTEFVIGGVASTYRRSTLKRVGYYDTDTMTEDIGLSLKVISKLGNRKKRIVYAADVVAMTGGVLTYRQLIKQRYRWKMGMLQNLFKYRNLFMRSNDGKHSRGLAMYRLPMAVISELMLLVSPLVIGYLVYASISHHTFNILVGAYITITLYVLWNVWPDEYLSLRQKLSMSLFSLFMYLIFFAMDLVQLIAVFKCMKSYKMILWRTSAHSVWVPPTRAVQHPAV